MSKATRMSSSTEMENELNHPITTMENEPNQPITTMENELNQPITAMDISENTQPSSKERELSSQLAQWRIYPRTLFAMTGLFLLGTFSALGHHFYYAVLDGRVNNGRNGQEWALRIGTGLSFLARASLVAAAAIAYKQSSWLRLRRRPTTIGGIDSILDALSDPSALTDMSMFRQSKMGSLFVILSWCVISTD